MEGNQPVELGKDGLGYRNLLLGVQISFGDCLDLTVTVISVISHTNQQLF
jgi:hypothetical protein